MKIIGITGNHHAGKNTVAGFLSAELMDIGFRVRLDGFGLYVRAVARREHGWNGLKDVEGVKILQRVGEDSERFCRMLDAAISLDYTCSDFLIIPDVRADNHGDVQAQFCRERGVLWHVTGRGGYDDERGQHQSEKRVVPMKCDTLIGNSSSFERLRKTIASAVTRELHLKECYRTASASKPSRRDAKKKGPSIGRASREQEK